MGNEEENFFQSVPPVSDQSFSRLSEDQNLQRFFGCGGRI
jgi:hypothetical protein